MAADEESKDHPATWENEVVGKVKEWVGKATHREDLVDEGESQDEVAHEVHEEFEDE